ncbi:MAG: FkbM family methyltransferase [Saprospiraceae bacterium]
MKWKARLGLWRSIIMYYWKPFNQRRLKKFYQVFIQPGDLCFDIGAHLGNRSKAWLALGAKVVALEPQPRCIKYLKDHFQQNPNFTLEEKAVAATPGTLPMYISHNSPTVSSLAGKEWRNAMNALSTYEIQWEEKLAVTVTTLDQLIAQYGVPTFCKIDVEDFEEEVLKGLSVAIPYISFEFFNWTAPRTIACLKCIDQLGKYRYNWSFGESQQLALTEWVDATTVLKDIDAYDRKESFSGDIYARLQT